MSQQLQVFILSMIPIIEQRGAIPLGFVYEMEPFTIFLLALFGSLVPSPFILLLFKQIYKFMASKPFSHRSQDRQEFGQAGKTEGNRPDSFRGHSASHYRNLDGKCCSCLPGAGLQEIAVM